LGLATGCSAKVEIERHNWDNGSGEKDRTAVEVELLHDQPSKPPKTTPAAEERPVNVSGSPIIIVVPGDRPSIQVKSSQEAEERAGHTGLNTKIGFPSHYWKHGLLAFLGYVIVCFLVGTAVVLMIETCKLTSGGPMFSTLALLVAAAIILQILPTAESAIQFIPLWPWSYSGFVPVCLSILCWLGLLVAVFSTIDGCLDSPTVFSAAVLFSMGLNLLLSFCSG
jgi:hypothetical protein